MNGKPRQDPIGTPRRREATGSDSTGSLRLTAWPDGYTTHNRTGSQVDISAHQQLLRQAREIADASATLLTENNALKTEVHVLKHELLSVKQQKQAAEYIAVLVNGNDLVPLREWVQLGKKGGRHFANRLTAEATTSHRMTPYDMMQLKPVVTKVYVDIQGLMEVYGQVGALFESSNFLDFVHGFNHCDAHSDMVDVGPVHTMTEERIANQLWHFLCDSNCIHIVLGCKAGIMIDRIMSEPQISQRVTLVSTAMDQNLVTSGTHKHLDLSTLFTLNFKQLTKQSMPVHSAELNHSAAQSHSTLNGSSSTVRRQSKDDKGAILSSSTLISTTLSRTPRADTPMGVPDAARQTEANVTSSEPDEDGKSVPWSKIASRAAKLPFKDKPRVDPPPDAASKVIEYNKDGQRLDPYMAYDGAKVLEMKKHRYCNQHFIGKGCCHWQKGNDNCPHVHQAKFSEEDKHHLRLVARETVCKKLPICRDPDCIYGHHCPYPKPAGGSVCINGDLCRFKAMHGMDLTVAKRIKASELRRASEGR